MKGILIPIGGNEDKGKKNGTIYPTNFISDGILSHILKSAKGVDSRVAIIPTASGFPKEVASDYLRAFKKLGCRDLEVLDIRTRKDANDERNCRILKRVDCILLTGGDQSKLSKIIRDSQTHEIMRERLMNDDIVIAGTSAGAVSMSKEMVSGGSSEESLIKGAVKMKIGLGFLPGLIIDSHFIRRGRFGRLAEAVARKTHLLGIGLAEDTGLVIRNGDEAQVIGSGMVILFDPAQLTHNKHDELKEGTPMSMSNLVVHILSNGDRFSVKSREVEVLDISEPFV